MEPIVFIGDLSEEPSAWDHREFYIAMRRMLAGNKISNLAFFIEGERRELVPFKTGILYEVTIKELERKRKAGREG